MNFEKNTSVKPLPFVNIRGTFGRFFEKKVEIFFRRNLSTPRYKPMQPELLIHHDVIR